MGATRDTCRKEFCLHMGFPLYFQLILSGGGIIGPFYFLFPPPFSISLPSVFVLYKGKKNRDKVIGAFPTFVTGHFGQEPAVCFHDINKHPPPFPNNRYIL